VTEEPFSLELENGVLHGHRGGDGPPALLLHGGPAFPDYTAPLAAELQSLYSTIRYTQRGTLPSTVGAPFTIEAHMGDALAVLDAARIDRAWAIGHSWGGHLALHLLVAHPERLLGVVCVNPLGAFGDVFEEFGRNLRRDLSEETIARIDEVEARRRDGIVTEGELVERFGYLWPYYFVNPGSAPLNPIDHVGVRCSVETNESLMEHFARGTLVDGLPGASLPVSFVHGELDPLPVRTSAATAALIPGARLTVIDGVGHFPWLERPGSVCAAI
jgi:proline iminopeptidase